MHAAVRTVACVSLLWLWNQIANGNWSSIVPRYLILCAAAAVTLGDGVLFACCRRSPKRAAG